MKKWIILAIILLPAFSFAACPAPVGTTYTAVDASAAEVQDCIDDAEAAAGGTVVIPAGTATYDATHYISKTVTKNLTVQGAGSGLDGTVITDGGADKDIPAITLVANGTVTLVIKNLRLVTKTAVTNDGGSMNIYGVSPNKVINNIYFDMTGITGGRMLKLGSYNDASHGYGVVHGCTFYNTTDKGQSVSIFGQAQGETWSWSGNPGFGTANAWFIEGNTFTNTTGDGDGALDAYAGAKIVWRYNNVSGTGIGWHGNDSSTGLHSIEVYRNYLVDPNNQSYYGIGGRGGTAVIWGNNIDDAYYPSTFVLSNYRSCDVGGKSSDLCDGSGADDANSDATGYRCYQQIGSTGTDGLTQWPIIEWDNTVNGTLNSAEFYLNPSFLGAACVAYGHGATYDMADHVQEGRDFINHDTCVGVTSDFCTAWWDDVNKKGKLNGSAYTPYTGAGECPHPLTGLTGACTTTAGTGGYNVATTHTVTVSTSTGCTVSHAGANTVGDGETLAVTMTAAYGYSITATGCTLSGSTCTTAAVTGDLSVVCSPAKHMMEGIGTGSGSITGIGTGSGTITIAANTTPSFVAASGGTETTDGDYKIHAFTASGTLNVTAGGNVEVLVVAGGGGGGCGYGGGGGGGGVVYDASHSVTVQVYSITVGAGGAGDTNDNGTASNGEDSLFDNITAVGGGGGGSGNGTDPGASGGSGGGSPYIIPTGGSGTQTASGGDTGYGHDGGRGLGAYGFGAGGGGGASAAGQGAEGFTVGDGGAGQEFSQFASIGGSPPGWFGGGGGAGRTAQTDDSGTGGAGGGGNGGSTASGNDPGDSGTANTGGGGGGGGYESSLGNGGAGGSGIVIIRYKYQ